MRLSATVQNISSLICLFTLFILDDHLILSIDYELVNVNIEHNDLNPNDLQLILTAFRKNFTIDLKENHFIGENYHEFPKDNNHYHERKRHCHYKGNVNGDSSSFAAISFCDNLLNGMFHVNGIGYHLQQSSNNIDSKNVKVKIFTTPDDHSLEHFRCGFQDTKPSNGNVYQQFTNTDENNLNYTKTSRRKKWVQKREIISESDIFRQPRYVEIVIVNDLKLYEKYDRKLPFLFERNIQIANIVNALYSPFNISIVLVGVVVWTDRDEIVLSNNSSETLNNFLKYRRDKLMNEFPNDNAQLITATSFENGIVGKALKQTMCTYEYSGGVNHDYHESISLIATTIAHELGHNFGMEHDHEGCRCSASNCIMGPSSSFPHPRHWSSCSQSQLKESLRHGLDYCLWNKPKVIFRPSCGNGIIDDGEECDCGLPGFCQNKCCNATTCKLTSNAQCAVGDCCDKNSCTIIPKHSGFVCRPSKSSCDRAEMCNGQSEHCPSDRFIRDGTECSEGYAYCFRGKCETREDRCHLLWGNESQVAGYRCYQNNANANSSGNCGYDKRTKTFIKCESKEDIICGRLHCSHHQSNRKLTLKYGPEGSTVISQLFESYRESITCFSALVDLGLDEDDVGLVPNGAKCGLNSMCVHQKCVQIDQFDPCKQDYARDDESCQSKSSSNALLIFIHIAFFLLTILSLIIFFIYKNKIPKNWFRQKAFISGDYNNRRPKKMNPAVGPNRTTNPQLETELSSVARPVRPAPPPPRQPIPMQNSHHNHQRQQEPQNHLEDVPLNRNKSHSPKPQISRPKRSPPKPPTQQPPPLPKTTLTTNQPDKPPNVKDLVSAFEKN